MTKSDLDRAVSARLAEVNQALSTLDDETALGAAALFLPWEAGTSYSAGERVLYGERLYRCVQPHTSQPGWEPENTPALWTEVAQPGTIPVWRQPTGAQDAYQLGDRVHYPGEGDPVYRSTVDNNVWAPDVYGWEREE